MRNLNNEKGLGLIGVCILIVFIVVVALFIGLNIKNIIQKENKSDVTSDMLLIQGACKVKKDSSDVEKNTNELVGTKLSEFVDNRNNENASEETNETSNENANVQNTEINGIDKKVIYDFLDKNIIIDNFDKYYVLTNDDLAKLKLDVKNQEGAYYIINYETNDVLTTKDVNGDYYVNNIKQ